MPHPCSYWMERSGCTGAGCVWDFDYCTGTPKPCSSYTTEFTCKAAGCSWQGATPTPTPPGCYYWSSDCRSANKNKCSCYDAVNWTYDCYTFWYCDNSKCYKPEGCYDYYSSCYTQNATKCSCQQAVKCKYNNTYNCYMFDTCDNSLCPPEGCVSTPTQCIENNAGKCACKDAVFCNYSPTHYCYYFTHCNNSLCTPATPTPTPTATPPSSQCYYDYVSCQKGNATPDCPYEKVVCSWNVAKSCYTFLKCDYNKTVTTPDTNELKCSLSVSASPSTVVSGNKVSVNVSLSCNQKVGFLGSVSDPFSGKQFAFSPSFASADGVATAMSSYSETYSLNVPISTSQGTYTVVANATVYKQGSSVPLNLAASANVVVYAASCGLNISVYPLQAKRGQTVKATAVVSCASTVQLNKVVITIVSPEGKSIKNTFQPGHNSSLMAEYTVPLTEKMTSKYFTAYADVFDATGAKISLGPAQAMFEIIQSEPCKLVWDKVPPKQVVPGSKISAQATLHCDVYVNSINVRMCINKSTSEAATCVDTPQTMYGTKAGHASIDTIVPIDERQGTTYTITVNAQAKNSESDLLQYRDSYTTTVVREPQACYMSLVASPTEVIRGGDATLIASVSCSTQYPLITITISSDGKSSSKTCGTGLCIPFIGCLGMVSSCSHSMAVFVPGSAEPGTVKSALSEAKVRDPSGNEISITANTSYSISSETPCAISEFVISPLVAYPGSTIDLKATVQCKVPTQSTRIQIVGPWGTKLENTCVSTAFVSSSTCTVSGKAVVPINIEERGVYTFAVSAGATDRYGNTLPGDHESSTVRIGQRSGYG
ncbi:MAG: hypothetical protein QXM75_01495 [Candidatus Diapherotrites archaeon]